MLRSWKKELSGSENETESQTKAATSGPTGATTPRSEITLVGSDAAPTIQTTPKFIDDALKRGAAPAAAGDYKPFGTEKRPETLDVRLNDDDGEIFDYMLIRHVSYRMRKKPQRITVYTPAGRLLIKGRNLKELREHFTRRGVSYVQLYDATEHAALQDDAPCIEAIDFWPVDGEKPTADASVPANDAA